MDLLAFILTGNPRALLVAIPNLLALIGVIVVVVIALRALVRIDRSLQQLVARGEREGAGEPAAPPTA